MISGASLSVAFHLALASLGLVLGLCEDPAPKVGGAILIALAAVPVSRVLKYRDSEANEGDR